MSPNQILGTPIFVFVPQKGLLDVTNLQILKIGDIQGRASKHIESESVDQNVGLVSSYQARGVRRNIQYGVTFLSHREGQSIKHVVGQINFLPLGRGEHEVGTEANTTSLVAREALAPAGGSNRGGC